MSISKNVGAITHILSRLLSNPTTNKIYQEVDTLFPRSQAMALYCLSKGIKSLNP